VLEPDLIGNVCVCAIGSGGTYALSSALSLVAARNENKCNMDLNEIAVSSMKIAAKICVFTNDNLSIEGVSVNDIESA
jgi:ATP-dependent HslUV protease subunit HslV